MKLPEHGKTELFIPHQLTRDLVHFFSSYHIVSYSSLVVQISFQIVYFRRERMESYLS